MKKLIIKLTMLLYKIKSKFLRRLIEWFIRKIDGDFYWSKSLRLIYEKYYGICIGMGSYGCFDSNRFPSGTKIGNYCSIAAEVRYLNANHPMQFVSTHPLFCKKIERGRVKEEKIKRYNLEIGNDVWIGYGVIIVAGCKKIGNGAVIGAGSIVTKDIEPYGIYAGSPARLIRKRFSDEICKNLEQSKWYHFEPEQLLKYEKEFERPSLFTANFKERLKC